MQDNHKKNSKKENCSLNIISLFFLSLVLSACSSSVYIESVKPAKADRASKFKQIAVTSFYHDVIGFSSKLEAQLANKTVNNQPFFLVLSRQDIDQIFAEQDLQYSGWVDDWTAIDTGQLVGAQALITGDVLDTSSSYSRYTSKRKKCEGKKCVDYVVTCRKMDSHLSAVIKMIDVQHGDIIFANTYQDTNEFDSCSEDLPTETQAIDLLADAVATQFVREVSPNKVSTRVTLLEDPVLSYGPEQKVLLETALMYMQKGYFEGAERLFKKLYVSTDKQCHVAAYNLGVVYEINEDFERSYEYYVQAEKLAPQYEEAIVEALMRIKQSQEDKKILQQQL